MSWDKPGWNQKIEKKVCSYEQERFSLLKSLKSGVKDLRCPKILCSKIINELWTKKLSEHGYSGPKCQVTS